VPDHFTLVEAVPGVHAAVAGDTGAAIGNAAVVDTGTRTLVVDTFMTSQASAELRAAAKDLTGRDAFLVVNTHWHSDHVRGNQTFADVPIVATPRTLELIVADTPADLAAYEEEIDAFLDGARKAAESDDPAERESAAGRLRTLQQLKESIPGFSLTLPQLLVDDHLVFDDGRRVELITHGPGHTDSDIFVWLPDDRAVVAGDLCWNAMHPRLDDGHPPAWAEVLSRMRDLGPEAVVPGHGPPAGIEIVEAMIPYMLSVGEMVEAIRKGADPGSLPPPAGSEAWDRPERMTAGLTALASK